MRVSKRVTRLVFIRHGHAQAAIDDIVAGHRGCRGLTDRGREQATALRDRLFETRELHADVLLTSKLPRAIETAEILAPALGDLVPQRDCDLCELHPGECDGLRWEEYRRRYGFDMRIEPERPMSPGGESLATFQVRVERCLRRLVHEHSGQVCVLVSHGGVVSAATLAFLDHGLNRERSFRLEPSNTSITEWLRPADEDAPWLLVRYNDCGHLSQAL